MTPARVPGRGRRPRPALRPVRDVRHGTLAGVEVDRGTHLATDRRAFTSALTVLPMVPAGAWVAIEVAPDFFTHLETSPLFGIPSEQRRRVTVEISAQAPVTDPSRLRAAVDVLRHHGVRLGVRHVGAGYPSLSRVLQSQPDSVTIDPSLVRGVGGDRAKHVLASAVVDIARDVGARVTADGVETADDLEAVVALGVDLAQGGLVGRPATDPAIWQYWSADAPVGFTRVVARLLGERGAA